MAYQYDVFLSYNCKFPHGDWVKDEFLPFFKPFLEDALSLRHVEIFLDVDEIKSGQAWEKKIINALIHSRIMVSVLTPAYFNSEWCKKEMAFMDYRQRECGYLTTQNNNGIIVPLKISDGESFPEAAMELQISDFNNYFRVGAGFKQTPLHVELQGKLQTWIYDVAHAHKNAPEWKEDWKHPDWVNRAWEDLDKYNAKKIKKAPVL